MKLREVSARNFRTLEDLTINFNADYCTLSGRNNAGKTAIVTIIRHFLDDEREHFHGENSLSFERDKTQWAECEEMSVSIRLELDRHDDAEIFFEVDRFAPQVIEGDTAFVRLTETFFAESERVLTCRLNSNDIDGQTASAIAKTLKSSATLVVHNSTVPTGRRYYYISGEMTEVLESHFSQEDRKKIAEAETRLSNRVKAASKEHKEELNQLLGRLGENYDVELTTLERGRSSRFPLSVRLNDKSVNANLGGWGSGTQNRTRVLISVLEANRIRTTQADANRLTPVVIVEEPESFLHPSAQAEFGKVLNNLADDFGIQILATTHSPYMLNQTNPHANLLLERHVYRKRLKETRRVETEGDDWMLPFADNLGVVAGEFIPWKKIVSSPNSKIVLVEGDIDVEYFALLKSKYPNIYQLPDEIEVVGYGGKDALKNTQVLQFMLSRLERVFITFDLDAEKEVKGKLESIGLSDGANFCAVGVDKPGKECIEGLLPDSILKAVYSENVDDVAALGSTHSGAKKSAKSNLKKAALEKFRATDLEEADLSEMKKLMSKIAKAFK